MVIGITLTKNNAELSQERDTLDNLNRFMSLIGAQDDRAMVLSLAAFIEDTLGRLLMAYFRNCKSTKELIEGFNAPLGTLSSRIKAAYTFGLVTEQQYKDMDILRKVRNHFAHNWEGVSLGRNDIKAMVGQLSGYTLNHKPIEEGERENLIGTLSTCCIELQVFLGRIEAGKVEKAPDVSHRLSTKPSTELGIRRFVK